MIEWQGSQRRAGLARPLGSSALLALVLLVAVSVGGCDKPLLSDSEERSQFDRYDAVRSQRAPPYVEDEFGRQRPNLRGRLLTAQ